MPELSTDLIVRGEQVQALYGQYLSGNLQVNRRYQRKLVWSVEEKREFIDSLLEGLPVPLILVAERTMGTAAGLEIIDGLQRLNAVFSFIEQQFSVHGSYFDLNTLAETKLRLDEDVLKQATPTMDRRRCISLAGYVLPISVYRSPSDETVDEVFRRINSNGRHLSRQEIRQAGCLSNFADLVRAVAASVRGDFSVRDLVPLQGMPAISVSNQVDGPGIFVDDIFWVKHKILDREQVRQSRDEEIIADLLASMLMEPIPPYDSRVLDEFYDLQSGTEQRADRINANISRDGVDAIEARFNSVLTTLEALLEESGQTFAQLIFDSPKQRVPRYFEAVFLGLDQLLHDERREFVNMRGAVRALRGIGNSFINIPGGGGTWTARSKTANQNAVAAQLRTHTRPMSAGANPLLERNPLMVENLLRASKVENSLLEMKQGFYSLAAVPKFNEKCLHDVLATATAMANSGPGNEGHILIGVADKVSDAARVEQLTSVEALLVHDYYVTGVDFEAAHSRGLDEYLLALTSRIRASDIDVTLMSQILRDMRTVDYRGRTVIWLRVKAGNQPVPYAGNFYQRLGSQSVLVEAKDVGTLFARFSGA